MNKYGYTIVELLAVLAIVALLFTVGVTAYSSLIKKANNTVYESYIDGMHEAAITYIMENGQKNRITLSELIANKKIDYINNPKNNNDKCESSYIDVTRADVNGVISYEYNVCLICDDYTNNDGQGHCKTFIN